MANASIRYGATNRKRFNVIKNQKTAKYKCEVCGKLSVERVSTSVWQCKHCGATYAGGAYTMTTSAGQLAKQLIEGLQKHTSVANQAESQSD
ncbi:MAG: 50S ribosomal protein L37ae [Candidatus Micrarchaeia archaeon]